MGPEMPGGRIIEESTQGVTDERTGDGVVIGRQLSGNYQQRSGLPTLHRGNSLLEITRRRQPGLFESERQGSVLVAMRPMASGLVPAPQTTW